MNDFPFDDLHGFKDYVGFVAMCAPSDFPNREGRPFDSQWSLSLAFEGLRLGIDLAKREKGNKPVFDECLQLIEQAYMQYQNGDDVAGFKTLDSVRKKIGKIRTE